MGRIGASASALLMALALPAAAQETKEARSSAQGAGELPVAEWSRGGPLALEDFRGQLTALVFYDDNES